VFEMPKFEEIKKKGEIKKLVETQELFVVG
jgi:hypothetical protein